MTLYLLRLIDHKFHHFALLTDPRPPPPHSPTTMKHESWNKLVLFYQLELLPEIHQCWDLFSDTLIQTGDGSVLAPSLILAGGRLSLMSSKLSFP